MLILRHQWLLLAVLLLLLVLTHGAICSTLKASNCRAVWTRHAWTRSVAVARIDDSWQVVQPRQLSGGLHFGEYGFHSLPGLRVKI